MKIKLFAMTTLFAVFASGMAAQTKSHAAEQTRQTTQPTKAAAKSSLKLLSSIPLPALKEGDFDHFRDRSGRPPLISHRGREWETARLRHELEQAYSHHRRFEGATRRSIPEGI